MDFVVTNHGSIWGFEPQTDAARDWWSEHVVDGLSFGRARIVEHRYAAPILEGIEAAGFTYETGRGS